MNFMLVNDEPSSHESSCTTCARRLRPGYLRHVRSRARFCDHDCYRRHQLAAAFAQWPLFDFTAARPPSGAPASRRIAVEAIAMSSAVAYWSFTTQMWILSRSLTSTFLSAHELMTSRGGDS
jgi:hypothetical protein